MTHQTHFKSDQPSRIDDRLQRDAVDALALRAVHRIVDDRDKRKCRACGHHARPDAIGLLRGHRHHIIYRSAGGADASANLVTLCCRCHNDEHQHRLCIDGDADDALTFWLKDVNGLWYVWRREMSVGIFEKD